MKIVSHYLNGIEGIGLFPIIGFILFFSFFLFLLYYVYHLDKGFVKEMGDIPVDNNELIENNNI